MCDGPNRSDRDGNTPLGNSSFELGVQMGDPSANAIRASRLASLHNRPDIRLQPASYSSRNNVLAIREAPI